MKIHLSETLILKFLWSLLLISFVCIATTAASADKENNLQVIYAVNAGGNGHIDEHGIHYGSDPLNVGTASDYGNHLLIIGRVPEQDEVLYRTERYHTDTFGYDLPLVGDGGYGLVLKFCEVYFNKPNMKIFDVVLNGKQKVISNLDIFAQVGRGTAHDEYIYFNVTRGKLYFKDEDSDISNNLVRLDFIKGPYDNPKVNAFVLYKGDIDKIPKLNPLQTETDMQDADLNEIPEQLISERIPATQASRSKKSFDDDDVVKDIKIPTPPLEEDNSIIIDEEEEEYDEDMEFYDPLEPDPRDEPKVMMPVVIAISIVVPLILCMCKL